MSDRHTHGPFRLEGERERERETDTHTHTTQIHAYAYRQTRSTIYWAHQHADTPP